MYRNQLNEMRAQMEDNTRSARDLEQERASLMHQLQLAIARADSEAIARWDHVVNLYAYQSLICIERKKTKEK